MKSQVLFLGKSLVKRKIKIGIPYEKKRILKRAR